MRSQHASVETPAPVCHAEDLRERVPRFFPLAPAPCLAARTRRREKESPRGPSNRKLSLSRTRSSRSIDDDPKPGNIPRPSRGGLIRTLSFFPTGAGSGSLLRHDAESARWANTGEKKTPLGLPFDRNYPRECRDALEMGFSQLKTRGERLEGVDSRVGQLLI
jgi:hypothetical protein